jgi:hypothetical protein
MTAASINLSSWRLLQLCYEQFALLGDVTTSLDFEAVRITTAQTEYRSVCLAVRFLSRYPISLSTGSTTNMKDRDILYRLSSDRALWQLICMSHLHFGATRM